MRWMSGIKIPATHSQEIPQTANHSKGQGYNERNDFSDQQIH